MHNYRQFGVPINNYMRIVIPVEQQLLSSANRGNVMAINSLLDGQQVSVNASNAVGQTSLHLAAMNNQFNAIHTLLQRGAEVNATDSINRTPLALAIEHNCQISAQILYQNGGVAENRDMVMLSPFACCS